jgi:hypothetical protein
LFNLLQHSPRLRLRLTLICLIACTLQSFVAQTHVHVAAQSVVSAASAAPSGGDSLPHRGGGPDTHCPLCQVAAHGGGAPLLASVISISPQAAGSLLAVESASIGFIAAVSYSWQSRGPPG